MKCNATILVILFSVFILETGWAQSASKNDNVLSVGYGLASFQTVFDLSNLSQSGYDINEKSGSGPLYIKYSRNVGENLSLGLSFATEHREYTGSKGVYTYKEVMDNTTWQVRLDGHLDPTEKMDPYVGIGVGYKNATWKYSSDDPNFNWRGDEPVLPLAMECTVGVRYYLISCLAVYGELGIAKSIVQFGVCGKF